MLAAIRLQLLLRNFLSTTACRIIFTETETIVQIFSRLKLPILNHEYENRVFHRRLFMSKRKRITVVTLNLDRQAKCWGWQGESQP